MKKFAHINVTTLEEATKLLSRYNGRAQVIAGGTDLLGQMKDEILPEYPEVIVNIKTIPGLDYIKEERNTLKIGALTLLEDIAQSKVVKKNYATLAEAAHRTASPHIREMGTIGGNISQSTRCWYYWAPDNRFHCMRKGNSRVCYATVGDNRYHSIFGGVRIVNPPCASACPTNVEIPSYLDKVREGKLREAAEILMESNPIPAITGRVCPHFCEQECNRGDFDEAVSVRDIERFMGDYIFENANVFFKPPRVSAKKTVAIVGSGPAGLSAAYYLRRLGYRVTVYDKMNKPGGMLSYGIPPYRLPKDIIKEQIRAFEHMGIEFKLKVEIGKDITLKKLMKDFNAVFVATGAWKEREAGIKGENLLDSGLEFLKNVNLGNRKTKAKVAAVIGGGNVAIDIARTLLRMGAKPVILYRRTEAEMPAVREEIDRAKEENIEIKFLTQPVQAQKKGNKIVLTCIKMKLGPLDETQRPQPVPVKGSEFTMEFDTVFKAIGEGRDTTFIPAEFLDKKGQLKIDSSRHLVGRNLFAGGDFVTGPATVVRGIAGGKEAAREIARYLGTPVEREKPIDKSPQKFNSQFLVKTSRVRSPELTISEGNRSIDVEDVLGLGLKEIESETNRCFNCSCLAVNNSDIAPALIALGAKIKTTKRVIEAEGFFAADEGKTTVLDNDELVAEIQIPKPKANTRSKYIKFALRRSIDFPIVGCASAIEVERGKVKAARICLNAVYNNPYRATGAEEFIKGKSISEATAEAAGNEAVKNACSLRKNTYKVQIAKTLVKRTILACASSERSS
jgi:NADPH-dependent glutamate synthase beta subunit-like oxidoreductase/CO/xanthine dehydrogenase FAD-binding subunit